MEKREDSSVVFPNTNLKNWKDFRVMRVEDEAYGKKGLETVKIFVYRGVEDEAYGKKESCVHPSYFEIRES